MQTLLNETALKFQVSSEHFETRAREIADAKAILKAMLPKASDGFCGTLRLTIEQADNELAKIEQQIKANKNIFAKMNDKLTNCLQKAQALLYELQTAQPLNLSQMDKKDRQRSRSRGVKSLKLRHTEQYAMGNKSGRLILVKQSASDVLLKIEDNKDCEFNFSFKESGDTNTSSKQPWIHRQQVPQDVGSCKIWFNKDRKKLRGIELFDRKGVLIYQSAAKWVFKAENGCMHVETKLDADECIVGIKSYIKNESQAIHSFFQFVIAKK